MTKEVSSDKEKKKSTNTKIELHPRNKNRNSYDLGVMCKKLPALKEYVQPNKDGHPSIDFSDQRAVKLLNQAILKHYYKVEYWDYPKRHLCPPVPGRAEYIHHVADLLAEFNEDKLLMGKKGSLLDIGTGATAIYPIIAASEYGWNCFGTDVDDASIKTAKNIVANNPKLKDSIKFKIQVDQGHIFKDAMLRSFNIDVTVCNPPFYASKTEAVKNSKRKIKNLTGEKLINPQSTFSGNFNELIYEGGEYQFIHNMISESRIFAKNIFWFTTLVSKESNLKRLIRVLKKLNPTDLRVIDIKTGNKKSRILAWTYLNTRERKRWRMRNWLVEKA